MAPINTRANTITISKIISTMRMTNGAYIGGSSSFNATSYLSSASIEHEQNLLTILIHNDNGWGGTNNTPMAGQVEITYTLS